MITAEDKMKAAAPFGTAAPFLSQSLELVRDVVERRAELRADVLHGSDSGTSDQGGDQAVFDGGGTLAVFNQLQKLAHGLAPWFHVGARGPTCRPLQAAVTLDSEHLGKSYP